MVDFTFTTDQQSSEYCRAILDSMMNLFGIKESEALGRMNRAWSGQTITGEDDPIYHEDEEYWAYTIFYGKDSNWWMDADGLAPIPFP